jgi:hypothetical protein
MAAAGWTARAVTGLLVAVGGFGPVPAEGQAAVQGLWRNADTTIRVVLERNQARGMFVEVGQAARQLGFKPGEVSFAATVDGHYLHGEQIIRYGGACHPNGRKVPMIARMTPDGRALAIHFYNISVDPNCRDTGEYSVTETLWQRVAGR